MKNIFSFFIIFYFLLLIVYSPVIAATSSPTPTTTDSSTSSSSDSALMKEIDNLKTKVVQQVEKLKLVEKQGIIGTVTDVTPTQITMTDINDDVRFVDIDEITKFSGLDNSSSFGISDITKGMTISVLGNYNKDSRHILARFIDEMQLPNYVSRTVTKIDRVNGTFTIHDSKGKVTLIDVESITRTYMYSPDTDLQRSGFSKMTTNERAIVIGYPDKKTPSMIISTRTLIFPDLSQSTTPSVSPSTTVIPTGVKK